MQIEEEQVCPTLSTPSDGLCLDVAIRLSDASPGQARQWRESMEAEQLRQEAAIRSNVRSLRCSRNDLHGMVWRTGTLYFD